jgi:hypothetical protein
MASTYSTNLKLELIGNGDQSGTWGTTTNTNLGTLLEQAIAGIENITISTANKVLTNLNGLSDESRNAVLVVTGSPGAVRNLLVPLSQTKTYIVVNNTTGGFDIGVQTWSGSGTTGTGAIATIPSGASIQIYCTGSNCYAIAPYTSITAVPVIFLGWASGTTLHVTSAPSAPIAIGQTVYNPGILYTTSGFPSNTTITAFGTGTGGTGTYTISNSSTVAAANFPQPITALATLNQIATVDYIQSKSENIYLQGAPSADTATAAAYEGTTSSATLLISRYYVYGNPIGLGQYLNGTGIADGSFVSAWGTGTPGNSVFSGYISGNTLTVVTGTITGTITNSQYLTANGTPLTAGTKITGGSGLSWTVNNAQTLGSISNPVTFAALGPITNATVAYNTSVVNDYTAGGWVTIQNDAQPLAVVVPRTPMLSYLSPLQLANVLWASNIASVVGTLGTQSDELVNILGGYLTNVSINNTAISNAVTTTQSFGDSTTSLATTAFVQSALQALYPIGCIYTSTVATNPNSIFGFGTWVAFGAGRVLVGSGGSLSGTGGSYDAVLPSHTHSATSTFTGAALPTHSHTYETKSQTLPQSGNSTQCWFGSATGTTSAVSAGTPSGSVGTSISTEGVSVTNANVQPYITVYMWNRTA